MFVDIETKRLKAIKEKFKFSDTKCESCGKFFRLEKMWHVWRGGMNHTRHLWCYCKHCMPTRETVLDEIDTDGCIFGIDGIDDDRSFKKDMTKVMARRPKHQGAQN